MPKPYRIFSELFEFVVDIQFCMLQYWYGSVSICARFAHGMRLATLADCSADFANKLKGFIPHSFGFYSTLCYMVHGNAANAWNRFVECLLFYKFPLSKNSYTCQFCKFVKGKFDFFFNFTVDCPLKQSKHMVSKNLIFMSDILNAAVFIYTKSNRKSCCLIHILFSMR